MYLIPAQQVQNINIPDRIGSGIFPLLHHFVNRRHRFQLTSGFCTNTQNILLFAVFDRGNGQQDLVNIISHDHTGNRLPSANHFYTMNSASLFTSIVINSTHRNCTTFRGILHFPNDYRAHLSCSHYHNAGLFIIRDVLLSFPFSIVRHTEDQSASTDERHG